MNSFNGHKYVRLVSCRGHYSNYNVSADLRPTLNLLLLPISSESKTCSITISQVFNNKYRMIPNNKLNNSTVISYS